MTSSRSAASPEASETPSHADVTQVEYWAQEGEHWVREAERYDAMNGSFGDVMLDAAQLQAGHRVLDVGCGNGASSLSAAERVVPSGAVVGIDISPPMLALARQRARLADCDEVEFIEADAQVHEFQAAVFDAVISRFGTMFFDDPHAGFVALHRSLRPGGRLAIVCWQDLFSSEWIIVPGAAAAEHVGLPDFGPPDAPGPFALADETRIRRLLETAGFADITIESVTGPMRIGDDSEDAITFITSLELVRNHLFAGKPDHQVALAVDAARTALEPYETPSGVIMQGGAWLVTARSAGP